MKIPKKIKMGDQEYMIKMRKKVGGNKHYGGQINYSSKIMELKKDARDSKLLEATFFHEITHCLIKELEYNYPKIQKFRNDEGFVNEMALLLRKFFLDLLEKNEK